MAKVYNWKAPRRSNRESNWTNWVFRDMQGIKNMSDSKRKRVRHSRMSVVMIKIIFNPKSFTHQRVWTPEKSEPALG